MQRSPKSLPKFAPVMLGTQRPPPKAPVLRARLRSLPPASLPPTRPAEGQQRGAAARHLYGLTPLPGPAPLPTLVEAEDIETETATVRRSTPPPPPSSVTAVRDDWRTPLPEAIFDPYSQAQAHTTPLPKPISEVRDLGRRRPAPAPAPVESRPPATYRMQPGRDLSQTPAPSLPVWHHHDAPSAGGFGMSQGRSGFQPAPSPPSSETRRVRGGSPAAIQNLQRQLRLQEEMTRATPVNDALLELTRQVRNRPLSWFLLGGLAGAIVVWFLNSDFLFAVRVWTANSLRSAKTETPSAPVATTTATAPRAPTATAPARPVAPPPVVVAAPPAVTFAQPVVAAPSPTVVQTIPAQPMAAVPAAPVVLAQPPTTGVPVAQVAPPPAVVRPSAPPPVATATQVPSAVDVAQLPKAAPPAPPRRQAVYVPPPPRPRPAPARPAPASTSGGDTEDLLAGALAGGGGSSSSAAAAPAAAPAPAPAPSSTGVKDGASLFSQALGD